MNSLSLVLISIVCLAMGREATVTGRVVGADGGPVAGARVFLEEDLTGPCHEIRAGADGRFQFEGVPCGQIGVFAYSEGLSFGGASPTVALGDTSFEVEIRLRTPSTVSGSVTDLKGRPVAKAEISRVGLLGETKVAIPFGKLKRFGIETPVTDPNGRFVLPQLPEGGRVALKISHPLYAQEGVPDVPVGQQDIRVTLQPGVTVRGKVLSRDGQIPVANAAILIRSNSPPGETTVAQTNHAGEFQARVKPGVYAYQAASAELRSPGWKQLVISGANGSQNVVLYVSGVGQVRGTVRNALTREPIAGAKVTLSTFGNPADVALTGPSGEYRLRASEGENLVRLDAAAGHRIPKDSAVRVYVSEGQDLELPVFWVLPIPSCRVKVVDSSANPVAAAAVTVLRPQQFGWWVTDSEGCVSVDFATAPPDGIVVGMVEHPNLLMGAAFAFDCERAEEARVQLISYGRVVGQVVTERNEPLEGAVVAAVLAEAPDGNPIFLWRTLSGAGGVFRWDGVPPGVDLRLLATDPAGLSGESAAFNVESGHERDVGKVVIARGRKGASMAGKMLKWNELEVIHGAMPASKESEPGVILYCIPEEAPMAIETLSRGQHIVGSRVRFVVVVEGAYSCDRAEVLVLQGKRPALATTYLVGADKVVVLETFGMPPLHAVANLGPPTPE